jgi:type VI secretion system protein ImpI/type VI secretion system protein
MTLTLTILRCPDGVPPQTRTVGGGEFSIGRGAENDWVLPDPERVLSKRHCTLAYRSGGWQVADRSTNGTFLNRENEPIGDGVQRDLRDGDRLRLGPYELEVHITEARPEAGFGQAASARQDVFTPAPFAHAGSEGRSFDQDPFLRRGPEEDPFAPGLAPLSVNLPPDFDPLAPDDAEAPFTGPTQPDHSPHLEDAFVPAPLLRGLPDDWDRDPTAGLDPVAAELSPVLPPAPVQQPSRPAPTRAPAAPVAAAEAENAELLAAFLRGTGLPEARPADPAAAMEALGAAFRALVSGVRLALIARAAIKGEFRIEQTMIRSRGNNPLKFSANDDDALLALLGVGRHSEMGAAEAVEDALRDMRLHEIATVAAMRSAVRTVISLFDPAKLRLAAEQGGLNLVPAQKKARAWDGFEALYARTKQALTDDFDAVFGKAFARGYEQALRQARETDVEQ